MKQKTYSPKLVYIIACIAATGGLLFGFDTGVISGAIPYLQEYFSIDEHRIETVTTAVLVGAILGTLIGGRLADILGRKKIILFSAAIFVAGSAWSGAVDTVDGLIAARLLLGVAIGISSFAVPLYIAEISPARRRGALVSLFQLLVTTGILVSYLSDLGFADNADIECWRMMFFVGIIPAVVLLAGMVLMPETPRWLMQKGRNEQSLAVLRRIEAPKI